MQRFAKCIPCLEGA